MADEEQEGIRESSDSEEWTLISEEELVHRTTLSKVETLCKGDQGNEVQNGVTSPNDDANHERRDREDHVEEADPCSSDADDGQSVASCSSSDIGILDDKEEFASVRSSVTTSLCSSEFSFIGTSVSNLSSYSHSSSAQMLPEDLSELTTSSRDEEGLHSDVDLNETVRHYVHKRNTRLNWILSAVVVMSVAMVVGLGVGHFLGWSDQWSYQQLVSRKQVLQLRRLQEELVQCMDEHNAIQQGMKSKFPKNYEEFKTKDKQAKAKLKQLEEEIIRLKVKLKRGMVQGNHTIYELKERVQKLEEENTELKTKISEDEEDSATIQELEAKIQLLKLENHELKEMLNQLQMQVESTLTVQEKKLPAKGDEPRASDHDSLQPKLKVTVLRQKVNQVVEENDELKRAIARLRYSQHTPKHGDSNTISPQSMVETLQKQLDLLEEVLKMEKNETEMWKVRYENLQQTLENSERERSAIFTAINNLNWTVFPGSEYNGSGVADVARAIMDYISRQQENVPTQVKTQLHNTLLVLTDAYHGVISKWEELKNSSNPQMPSASKVVNRMSELLNSAYRKFQHAGEKFLTNPKPLQDKVNKLASKTASIIEGLGKKWDAIRNKLLKQLSKTEKKGDSHSWPHFEEVPTPKADEREIPDTGKYSSDGGSSEDNWYLLRADARKESHRHLLEETNSRENGAWFFERANDRERKHKVVSPSQQYGDWYKQQDKVGSRDSIDSAWFFERANDRERKHKVISPTQQYRDWYTRWAKARDYYRQLHKTEEFDDHQAWLRDEENCASDTCFSAPLPKQKSKNKRKQHSNRL